MPCSHGHTVRIPVPSSHVQMASNGIYAALPYTRSTIGIWNMADFSIRPVELDGHRKTLSALSFNNFITPCLLCSGADDYIIVWNIERVKICAETDQPIRGQVIGTTLGHVQYLSFSYDDNSVAACIGKEVLVLDSRQEKTVAVLEGHTAEVNCAKFCPHFSATLVSTGVDRTYKIWNISNFTLVYQSSIISPSPFVCITMDPVKEHFAIGSSDGQVRVFDLSDGNGFRCLHQLDVHKLLQKITATKHKSQNTNENSNTQSTTISSRPKWKQGECSTNDIMVDNACSNNIEYGTSIFDMLYNYPDQPKQENTQPPNHLLFLQRESTLVSDLLKVSPVLNIATTSSIVQVNANTLELASCTDLLEPISTSSLIGESEKILSWAGNATLAKDPHFERVWCMVGSCFQNEVNFIELLQPSNLQDSSVSLQQSQASSPDNTISNNLNELDNEKPPTLSLLSSSPLCDNSPLKSQLVLKEKKLLKSTSKSSNLKPGHVGKTGSIVDNQPITFKNSVKSSGYSQQQPRQQMFQPKTNFGKSSSVAKISKGLAAMMREYPQDKPPPTEFHSKIDVSDRPTAINSTQFSSDGSQCACALSNTSAQLFKLPFSSGKGCAFTGHKGLVSHVEWSHDDKWIVTSSDDKTACLWSLTDPDPVMTFSTFNNNFGVDKEGGLKPDKENPLFTKPVKYSQFYYVDKFIMLTNGNSFYMYKYHLQNTKSDIKRYLSYNRYKLVKSFQLSGAQNITAFKAINSFHSYLTLAAGSDKTLEIFDMNVSRSIRVLTNVHTKAVHCIALNEGSQFSSLSNAAYDLFATAAASDCVKLWDLRTNRCVRKYEGHVNRSLPCGITFSPCSRFLATGSEDRSAYIYDMRAGTYLHKLTGHTDTVSTVTFHPLHTMLLTGTLDGKLRTFVVK